MLHFTKLKRSLVEEGLEHGAATLPTLSCRAGCAALAHLKMRCMQACHLHACKLKAMVSETLGFAGLSASSF